MVSLCTHKNRGLFHGSKLSDCNTLGKTVTAYIAAQDVTHLPQLVGVKMGSHLLSSDKEEIV